MVNKEECIKTIINLYNKSGKVSYAQLREKGIGRHYITKYFKTLSNAHKELGLNFGITEEMCLKEISAIYNKNGKVTYQILKEQANISGDTVRKIFGSMENAVKQIDGGSLCAGQRKMISEENLKIELDRINDVYGYVSKPLMEKYSIYNPKVVNRIYGNFTNMYAKLGYNRSRNGYTPSDEELILDCKNIYNKVGFLSYEILEQYSKFSITCFKDRVRKNNWDGINYYRKQVGCELPSLEWGESYSAKAAINIFSAYFKETPIKEHTFEWLINPETGMKLRIDAYYPNHNVALEYNGPQHYYVDGHYTRNENDLLYKQRLDKLKYELIKDHNINLIVIHFKDIVTNDYIEKKIISM